MKGGTSSSSGDNSLDNIPDQFSAAPCNFSSRSFSLRKKEIMKTFRAFIILSVSSVLMTGCSWYTNHTVVGTGEIESMEVPVKDFTGVSVTGRCNVHIETGESERVVYRAQNQILDVMTYEVRNGILFIGFKPGFSVNTGKEISASIVVPAISSVAITGAGDYKLLGSKQPDLDIYVTGTGSIDASGLEVDNCTIKISGTGDCDVWVNNNLDVEISGVGNVAYKGSPNLTSDVSGVGNVVNTD